MTRLNWLDWTAFVLLIVGGLNLGLVGFFSFNLITAVFGVTFGGVIFAIIGLAAIYSIYSLTKVGTMAQMKPGEKKDEQHMRRAA